ncbi:MAG: hypothetical protein D8M28_00740 [Proteobacteria bacterium]|nr:hypothetical protein [Pseudomonadota bacterium]
MKKILFISTLLISFTFSDYSRADTVFRNVALGCNSEANQFMVRFGETWNSTEINEKDLFALTPDLKDKWASMSLSQSGECTLMNGKKIKLSKKRGQAFAYGYLGGDPSVFFYLSIDDTAIYHKKTFYLKGGEYMFSSIYYDGDKLIQCHHDKAITCKDVSERLSGTALNINEMAELKKDKDRENLEKNLSQFCKDLRPTSSELMKQQELIKWEGLKLPTRDKSISKAIFDINNDQVDEVVLKVAGTWHALDGSFLMAFKDGSIDLPNFLQKIEIGELDILKPEEHAKVVAMGGTIISIRPEQVQIKYSSNLPFQMDEATYIYSYPKRSDYYVPSAFISKVRPDYSIETMCEFP